MKISRRQFMKGGLIAGVAMSLPMKLWLRNAYPFYQSPGLSKFAQPLRTFTNGGLLLAASDGVSSFGATHYSLNIGQYADLLHPSLNPTQLYGYFQ